MQDAGAVTRDGPEPYSLQDFRYLAERIHDIRLWMGTPQPGCHARKWWRTWHKVLDQILWCGVNSIRNGVVVQNGMVPTGLAMAEALGWVMHTEMAAAAARSGTNKDVLREHAVPRKKVREIVTATCSVEDTARVVQAYCPLVVYVHRSEDRRLPNRMPNGWGCDWSRPLPDELPDPWARYRAASLVPLCGGRPVFV